MFQLVKQIVGNIISLLKNFKMQMTCCTNRVCVRIEPSISVHSIGSSPIIRATSNQTLEPD